MPNLENEASGSWRGIKPQLDESTSHISVNLPSCLVGSR